MKIFLSALLLVALCLVGLCFNILFRKNGQFPQTEIEKNDDMKRLGIKCAKQEEMALWKKRKASDGSLCGGEEGCSSCAGCDFYKKKTEI